MKFMYKRGGRLRLLPFAKNSLYYITILFRVTKTVRDFNSFVHGKYARYDIESHRLCVYYFFISLYINLSLSTPHCNFLYFYNLIFFFNCQDLVHIC